MRQHGKIVEFFPIFLEICLLHDPKNGKGQYEKNCCFFLQFFSKSVPYRSEERHETVREKSLNFLQFSRNLSLTDPKNGMRQDEKNWLTFFSNFSRNLSPTRSEERQVTVRKKLVDFFFNIF